MKTPVATYRVQFRGGMDFDRAIEIVPCLKRLGVSHLYASPVFTATTGSTHGYDITDYNAIDPAIGGRQGLERLNFALRDEGLGLILDIVPNHMAASLENRWWRSVLEWGAQSPFANHFDIDWSERITLPLLGQPFEDCVKAGELSLALDTEAGCLTLAYYDNLFPLHPASYEEILARFDNEAARRLIECAGLAAPGAEGRLREAVRSLGGETVSIGLARDFAAASREADFIRFIHDEQPWRLTFWKDARRHLTYRRFFEVTGLVGTRVEDEIVFEDAHRLILELVRTGMVDGLRVDHVDGLSDPAAYMERLREAVGPDIYLTVEKIVEKGEELPADWPISGTTGYEFIAAIAGALIDREGLDKLGRAHAAALGAMPDLASMEAAAKRQMLRENFEGEFKRLVGLCGRAIEASREMSPVGNDAIGKAIDALVTAFPVYRTYGNAAGLPRADADLLDTVAQTARAEAGPAVDTVLLVLKGAVTGDAIPLADEFRTRFQQLTGPIMAKAIEDTLFYRYNRLIALNEVGGDPAPRVGGAAAFHTAMKVRRERQPFGLSAGATHDTKRGEDARARLYTLTERPDAWAKAVDRWRRQHHHLIGRCEGGPAPEPDTEWLIYQALAGVWPEELNAGDGAALKKLSERFLPYLEKAMREAKRRTSWTQIDEAYEEAVKSYAKGLLSPDNRAFLDDFCSVLTPFIRAGHINSLSQTLLRMTAPGVPDIYEGAEHRDLSLVDPDNRRAVDFTALARKLETPPAAGDPLFAYAIKQRLIAACLAVRGARPELFTRGRYTPLKATGPRRDNVVAFLRSDGEASAVTIVPRLPMGLLDRRSSYAPRAWAGTMVELPDAAASLAFTDALTGRAVEPCRQIDLATALAVLPIGFRASFSFEKDRIPQLPAWSGSATDAG